MLSKLLWMSCFLILTGTHCVAHTDSRVCAHIHIRAFDLQNEAHCQMMTNSVKCVNVIKDEDGCNGES